MLCMKRRQKGKRGSGEGCGGKGEKEGRKAVSSERRRRLPLFDEEGMWLEGRKGGEGRHYPMMGVCIMCLVVWWYR